MSHENLETCHRFSLFNYKRNFIYFRHNQLKLEKLSNWIMMFVYWPLILNASTRTKSQNKDQKLYIYGTGLCRENVSISSIIWVQRRYLSEVGFFIILELEILQHQSRDWFGERTKINVIVIYEPKRKCKDNVAVGAKLLRNVWFWLIYNSNSTHLAAK